MITPTQLRVLRALNRHGFIYRWKTSWTWGDDSAYVRPPTIAGLARAGLVRFTQWRSGIAIRATLTGPGAALMKAYLAGPALRSPAGAKEGA